MHGHVQTLIDEGVTTIFYPCMSYNLDEKLGDNHYNCPVVAYYPEVIAANVGDASKITLIHDYLGLHRKRDFPVKAHAMLNKYFDGITLKEVKKAAKAAYEEYYGYFEKVRAKGEEILETAEKEGKNVIVLAGRPITWTQRSITVSTS